MKSTIRPVSGGGRLNLFFMEMIIVLLFFGIASTVILRTFAESDRLSRESGRLERMSFCAQSAAELFSETGSLSETAEKLFGIETEEASQVEIPLDGSCRYDPYEPSMYMTMTVSQGERRGLYEMRTEFLGKDGETLYEIKSGAYFPGGKDGDGGEL